MGLQTEFQQSLNNLNRQCFSDDVGDLNGITEKLPYLKEIGMTGVWLSPIFQSPMADFGYDISNYTMNMEQCQTLRISRFIASSSA
jgi:glycosidase